MTMAEALQVAELVRRSPIPPQPLVPVPTEAELAVVALCHDAERLAAMPAADLAPNLDMIEEARERLSDIIAGARR